MMFHLYEVPSLILKKATNLHLLQCSFTSVFLVFFLNTVILTKRINPYLDIDLKIK